MLGRKDFTEDELNSARTAVAAQLKAYRDLVKAVDTSDPKVAKALTALEPVLFDNMLLALDRYFVHRVRLVAGKDASPVNELELLAESLMSNGGVLRTNNVIKYVPAETVLELEPGDRIALSAADFERFATAFLTDIETKFR